MPNPGFLSASSFEQLMKPTDLKKEQYGDGCQTLAYKIALERLGVQTPEAYGAAIDWGNEHEWSAIEAYKEEKVCDVVRTEFISHPSLAYVGGTPDGLVGLDGIIEVKCPHNPIHHARNRATAEQYHELYKPQCQGYLWITGRNWVDFVSFDPRYPEKLQLSIHRFERDQDYIDVLASRVRGFLPIIDNILNQIK